MRLSLAVLALAAAGCHVTTVLPGAAIAPGYDAYVVSDVAAEEVSGSLLLHSAEVRTWEVDNLQQPLDTVDPITLEPFQIFDPTILDLPQPLPGAAGL